MAASACPHSMPGFRLRTSELSGKNWGLWLGLVESVSGLGLVADSGQYTAPLISHTRHTLSSLLFFSYVTSFVKLLLFFSIDYFNKEIQCG